MLNNVFSFVHQCVRVWYLLRKPTTQELKIISKVSLIGLGLVGLIGFLINLGMAFFGLT